MLDQTPTNRLSYWQFNCI